MTKFVQDFTQELKARGLAGLAALGIFLIAVTAFAPEAFAQRTIRDAEIEELLREYANPLYVAAGLNPQSINMYVVNDPTLNAFVAGGQNMFIHTGLILASDTPNELIGVMAHESGHIAGGHLARMGEVADGIAVPAYIGAAIGLGLMIAGMPEAGMAVMMGGQTYAQGEFLAYSRVQESAADQAAMTYLEGTQQSGVGLLAFFDRFRDQEAMLGVNQDPFVRSHPLNPERIALLERRVGASEYRDMVDSDESVHRFQMVQAKIRGFLERTDIVMRRYPPSDTSLPAHYARSVAYFRDGRSEAALEQIDYLIAIEPNNPYFRELRGQILFESGRIAESVEVHREAVAIRPDISLLRINLGQALLAMEEDGGDTPANQEAIQNLQYAVAWDNTSSFAWYQLAIAYGRTGDEGRADLAVAEQYYAVRDTARAREFAIRARDKLEENSVRWNRAMDILYLTEDGRGRRTRR